MSQAETACGIYPALEPRLRKRGPGDAGPPRKSDRHARQQSTLS
jgi:hypothetical protein